MPQPPLLQIDDLLATREAKILSWSIAARFAFLFVFIVLLIFHIAGIIDAGIVAATDTDAKATILIIGTGSILMCVGFVFARHKKYLILVGTGALCIDLVMLAILPILWLNTLDVPGGSPAFLMKNELFTLAMVILVINSLTLRPLYPILMAGGIIVIHLVIMFYVLDDARVVTSYNYAHHFYTEAVNPGIYAIRIMIVAIIGAVLSFMAYLARRTVHDAVNLELNNHQIREQQAELIHEGRMSALSSLVAGVMHEVNTPLGALKSSSDTVKKSVIKLSDETTALASNAGITSILNVLKNSDVVTQQAIKRISELVTSLREFTSLDESETRNVDIRKAFQTTLSLIDTEMKGQVVIRQNYEDIILTNGRPKELNQVFYTLLVNAFEALNGTGKLHISVLQNNSHIEIKIADNGPGIPEDKLNGIFQIGFTAHKGRMSMGLGLPMSQRIIQSHGGIISVNSKAGTGTTFTISLPEDGTGKPK